MPQTTRGSIEEGSAQFQNQDYKDVSFDTNSAGRSHRGQVSIKCTGVDMIPYDNPLRSGVIVSTWTASAGVTAALTIADSVATSWGLPVLKAKTATIRFEEDNAPYDSSLTTTSKIQVPKYRISWRASEGSNFYGGSGLCDEFDYFKIQISPDGTTWTNVASPVYRAYSEDMSYTALSTGDGQFNGDDTHSERFYHFYIDVDQSGQHESANYLRFFLDSNSVNDGYAIYDLQISGLASGQDMGLSNANIGISFTNITDTGFRIELSSKLRRKTDSIVKD